MSEITMFKLQQEMSGHYLTEELPDNWREMDEEEQDEFLDEHQWEPFEYAEAKFVWEQIDQVASSVASILKSCGVEVGDE